MTLLTVSLPTESVEAVIKAILLVAPNADLTVWAKTPWASDTKAAAIKLNAIAAKVADAVLPTPETPIRKEVLRLLDRGNTFDHQKGEKDDALRNGVGAVSKALKSVFPSDDFPLERMVTKKKRFFEDGSYKGTEYWPTALGERVFELLKEKGAI